jgi:imidazolonepropionase-like amidohydrolase
MTVVVEGEKIAHLKPGEYRQAAGEGERVLDLEGGYVLPGLWNVHTHLSVLWPDPKHLQSSESAIDRAIRAGRNCMDALRAGVTGIRVVGERDFIDVAWKRAFDAGVFVGPRLFVCGRSISATGGHGDLAFDDPSGRVDGPYEMRKAVRERLKHGVDQIKVCVSGGHAEVIFGAEADEQAYGQSQLFPDEIQAATEVARQKGKRVCVHGGGEAMKVAIRAGVDCIEHGYFMDDETVEMMVENDVFYDPTLVCNEDEQFMLERGGMDKFPPGRVLVAKNERVTPEYAKAHVEGFQKALKAGVKIVCGAEPSPVAEFTLLEIEHLVRAGMTEMEALIAATRTCADLCGVVDRLGTVEVGKLADLIVLSADPLENISNIRRLDLVLKGGKLVETREPEGLVDWFELYF